MNITSYAGSKTKPPQPKCIKSELSLGTEAHICNPTWSGAKVQGSQVQEVSLGNLGPGFNPQQDNPPYTHKHMDNHTCLSRIEVT